MEWMSLHVLWWHWVVLGILLTAAEIVVPSLVIIWLGLAALVVGALDWFCHCSFSTELYLWTGLSVLLLALWFGYFRRTRRSLVGQAEGEHLHIPGRITEKLANGRYRAEFELPVLGDRRWVVESREPLEVGDPVEVVRVYGQIIKVHKRRSHS
jgi:membrane protein implicated in regulation of membrane protease activity